MVLDVERAALERAPSFESSRWPDVGDLRWADGIRKFWADASITAAVKTKLARETQATLTKVDIDTSGGVVHLNGTSRLRRSGNALLSLPGRSEASVRW